MICWCYDVLTLIENALTGQTAARPLFTPCVKRVRNGSFYFKNLFLETFRGLVQRNFPLYRPTPSTGVGIRPCGWLRGQAADGLATSGEGSPQRQRMEPDSRPALSHGPEEAMLPSGPNVGQCLDGNADTDLISVFLSNLKTRWTNVRIPLNSSSW